MLPPPPTLAQSVLNAVATHIAVVAADGKIVAVNDAWRAFAQARGDPGEAAIGVGADYLGACRVAEARGDESAAMARLGIEAVLGGDLEVFHLEYPCGTPEAPGWYAMRVSRLADCPAASPCVVVAHDDITARKQAEDALRRSHDLLEARVRERTAALECSAQQTRLTAHVLDSAVEGIVVADAQRNIVTVNRAFTQITGYTADEVLGRNPRLYSSGRHGAPFYEAIWRALDTTGHWQGEIWNRRKSGEVFPAWESIRVTRDAQGRVLDYISVFSDISSVKSAESRLAYLAHHDPLTGLANRLLFSARLEQAIEHAQRHGRRVGLLFIDLDNFKFVNDSLGHLVGDAYLKQQADRLVAHVRAEDTVARLGGDEFAVITEDLAQADDAGALADKLLAVLSQPVSTAGHEVQGSASVGIGVYPDDAATSEDLLKAADAAMYHAKAEGRHTARYFRPELGARTRERAALVASLRQAVARRELRLYYQPQVALATGRIAGLEALLRWDSPEHGLVMPERFIALAEETRLIQPIGRWVIEQALRDLAAWRAQGLAVPRVAVNVSWQQFNDARFVDRWIELLDAQGLPPHDLPLDVEITESMLDDSPRALRDLQRLRERGARVLIDDFGTGHSSLSQLIHLPVDGLKIDRLFLRDATHDAHSRAIVRAVIALAASLQLDAVAEGVETEAQAALLRAEQCRFAQGLLFGAAVPADAVPGLLRVTARDGADAVVC
jgi:diguanylate cyclase (GGDEF)-like protein/PAS domain S-box-containing protein